MCAASQFAGPSTGHFAATRRERVQQKARGVVDLHFFGLALGLPLTTTILECAHALFHLGVHQDHRLASMLKLLHARVDVFELGVAIRMRTALQGLAVALQAVIQAIDLQCYKSAIFAK